MSIFSQKQLRTPLKTARGLGSAKDGTHHFVVQRVTAIALIFLSLYIIGLIVSWIGGDYATYLSAAWARGYLQGAGVGEGADAGVWATAPMPQWDPDNPIAINWGGSAFSVSSQASNPELAAKVAFHHVIAIDHFANLQHFLVAQLRDPAVDRDFDLLHDFGRILLADAMNVLKRNQNALVGRDIHASNTGHRALSCYRTVRGPAVP